VSDVLVPLIVESAPSLTILCFILNRIWDRIGIIRIKVKVVEITKIETSSRVKSGMEMFTILMPIWNLRHNND
jgi:hypothetical protein